MTPQLFPPITLTAADRHFFETNGYLVVEKVWSAQEVDTACQALADLRNRLASESGIPKVDYEREINQLRDLWRTHPFFTRALLDANLAPLAADVLGQPAATLFHDHVINKPKGISQEVPWHQDYAYWPVDTPESVSIWLSLDDLDLASGVLEVIPGSHRLGEQPPVDFMHLEELPLDQLNAKAVPLPVCSGDAVLLHALTWHRSQPNTQVAQRRAYITLWLPPQARYCPAHAPWHPINQRITVPPGAPLNTDWFPTLPESATYTPASTAPPSTTIVFEMPKENWSMFNASKYVKTLLETQLQRIGDPTPLAQLPKLLLNTSARKDLAQRLTTPKASTQEIDTCLHQWAIQQVAYRHHQGRNVYNEGFQRLIQLFDTSS